MYAKLFGKILDSSIWLEPDPIRIVWFTFLAAMDEHGFCSFAAPGNVASRARVSLDDANTAIEKFQAPDPYSSDPDNEGRRIERVPGGWIVLNAGKYRETATRAESQRKTNDRVRRFREKKRCGNGDETPCNAAETTGNAHATPSEAYTNAKDIPPPRAGEAPKQYPAPAVSPAFTESARSMAEPARDYFEGRELQVANDLFREFKIPGSHALTTLAGQALVFECERLGSAELAIESMRAAMGKAKTRGDTINRFWFEDQQYDESKLKARESNGANQPGTTQQRLNGTRTAIAEAAKRRGLDPTFLGISADGRKVSGSGNPGQRGGLHLGSGTVGDAVLAGGSDPSAGGPAHPARPTVPAPTG